MSDTWYYKKGNKYIPAGYEGPSLHPGIWLVQVEPGCKSTKNLSILLSDLPDPTDLQVLAKTVMLEKIILKTMLASWPSDHSKSSSLQDCATAIAKALTKEELKLRKLTQKDMRGEVC